MYWLHGGDGIHMSITQVWEIIGEIWHCCNRDKRRYWEYSCTLKGNVESHLLPYWMCKSQSNQKYDLCSPIITSIEFSMQCVLLGGCSMKLFYVPYNYSNYSVDGAKEMYF